MWNEQMKPMAPQSQFWHVILHLFAKLPWSEKWLKDENATGILFLFFLIGILFLSTFQINLND